MKNEKNAVAVANENTGVAVSEDLDFMLGDFGAGFEGADGDSFAIPFLKLLQKTSPEVDEDNAGYIQGAKAGMLMNTVTNRLFDAKAGFHIIPCAYKRSFILWGGRESANGGFKGELSVEEFAAIRGDETKVIELNGKFYVPDEEGKIDEKKSDRYDDTRSHYVIVIDPQTGDYAGAVLSCSSTQIKSSKMLMTALSQKKVSTPQGPKTPPSFANMVKVTTVGRQNDKGSWSALVFELDGLVSNKDHYTVAKDFYQSFTKGEINADYSKAEGPANGGEASGEPTEAEGF